MLFLLSGAPVAPVAFHEVVSPSEFKDNDTRTVLMDEDRVGDLPLKVNESGAIKMTGQGRKLGRQAGEERARCGAPRLREARAVVSKCLADAGTDGVVSCRNSVAKCGAKTHNVGGRSDLGTTGADAVLLPSPFDEFGHRGELPYHKADAGLSGTWSQILEGAAKHVALKSKSSCLM